MHNSSLTLPGAADQRRSVVEKRKCSLPATLNSTTHHIRLQLASMHVHKAITFVLIWRKHSVCVENRVIVNDRLINLLMTHACAPVCQLNVQ